MAFIRKIYVVLSLLAVLFTGAQNPVNCYAKVTGISGNVLTLSNVNETYHTFEDGDYIIILQMQDDVIGANTTNGLSFGNLGSIQSAGLFEIARIASHTESGSLPNAITLSAALANTYHTGTNSSVQIISFRFMGTNYTTSSNIGTLPWNGNVGGVTAFSVTSVFTLAHTISANGCGFAGGSKNTPNTYSACDDITYVTTLSARYAGKGEGIYKRTSTALGGARGKLLNGGGGGNDVNAGGGGGGNYTSGGTGGSGWTPSGTGCSPIAGGIGGLSLSSSISGSRVFMGGGGGGGHENDAVGTPGGAGGGIIFIKAASLVTSGCSGAAITANGVPAGNAANDGAGGGGAGGSIVLQVSAFSVSGACPLTVSSNGGNGGNANASSSGAHGGGGGGGQGAVIYPAAQPVTNITTNTIPGSGGVSCSGCSAAVNGAIGSGSSNSGIIVNGAGPLPVELLKFEATEDQQGHVLLKWLTAVEKNSDEFVIQRMDQQQAIVDLAHIRSKGNNSSYDFTDNHPAKGINYYRLKQVDLDGTASFKNWVEINTGEITEVDFMFYPNPVRSNDALQVAYYGSGAPDNEAELFNASSGLSYRLSLKKGQGQLLSLHLSDVAAGVYALKLAVNGRLFCKKLVVLD